MMQNSLFDLQNRYTSLSEASDPLERLNAVIDWEMFRPLLERIDIKERKNASGRKATCRILMLKLLILQRLHNLSVGSSMSLARWKMRWGASSCAALVPLAPQLAWA